jgi:hypothetical protein
MVNGMVESFRVDRLAAGGPPANRRETITEPACCAYASGCHDPPDPRVGVVHFATIALQLFAPGYLFQDVNEITLHVRLLAGSQIGLDLGMIPRSVFTMLVLKAVVGTSSRVLYSSASGSRGDWRWARR